ncbi:MAG: rhomboid family intramembrane serine protease [Desulfobulbaceae bacterium]|nr:rhomboid family intramembrane serine protease [Desulfobulbaceae bacterium]
MFPLRDENPTFHTSVATFAIIALNAATWVLLQGMGTNPVLAKSLCLYGFIPGEFLQAVEQGVTIPLGQGLYCVTDAERNWLSPLTSMFMHGGWAHLIINMWFLFIFGDNVEDVMGYGRFIVFYLVCGFAAVAAQMISNPSSIIPMVGASGAIGGVMGGYAVLFPKAPVHMLVFLGFLLTRIVVPAYFMLGYWFLLQLVSAVPAIGRSTGGVAFWAHIGGFLAGVVLVKLFVKPQRMEARKKKSG